MTAVSNVDFTAIDVDSLFLVKSTNAGLTMCMMSCPKGEVNLN